MSILVGWANVQTVLLGEWASIAGPRLYILAGLGAAAGAIWLVVHWRYDAVIVSLRARLKLAEERNRILDREFVGMTPAQTATRLRRLEALMASLPPRRLSSDQRRVIAEAGCPPAAASYLTVVHDKASAEAIRYARDFFEAFSAAPGWNVIDEFYSLASRAGCVRIAKQRLRGFRWVASSRVRIAADAALEMLGPVLERDPGEMVRGAKTDPDLDALRDEMSLQVLAYNLKR